MRIESTETLVEEANEKFEQKVKENDLLKENHQYVAQDSVRLKKDIEALRGELVSKVNE